MALRPSGDRARGILRTLLATDGDVRPLASSESLPPERVERLLMPSPGGDEQALHRAHLPARVPHGGDELAEPTALRPEILEALAGAVTSAPRRADHHQTVVLPVGEVYHQVCVSCGWVSAPHVSAWAAARERCALHAAELERAQRAHRFGPVVAEAARALVLSGGR